MDLCSAGSDGTCIPGTTFTFKDLVTYEFDDQDKIVGMMDWWEPGTFKKYDSLLQQTRAATKAVGASSYESQMFWSTNVCGAAMVGAVTFFVMCAVAKGCFELGKR